MFGSFSSLHRSRMLSFIKNGVFRKAFNTQDLRKSTFVRSINISKIVKTGGILLTWGVLSLLSSETQFQKTGNNSFFLENLSQKRVLWLDKSDQRFLEIINDPNITWSLLVMEPKYIDAGQNEDSKKMKIIANGVLTKEGYAIFHISKKEDIQNVLKRNFIIKTKEQLGYQPDENDYLNFDYESLIFDEKSNLLFLKLKDNQSNIKSQNIRGFDLENLPARIGKIGYYYGVDSEGSNILENVLITNDFQKQFQRYPLSNNSKNNEIFVPFFQSFKTNLKMEHFSTSPISTPIFSENGNVMGIWTSQNLSLWMPSNHIKKAIRRIEKSKNLERTPFGATIKTNGGQSGRQGVFILRVSEGSIASKFGLKMGDIIKKWDSKRVESVSDFFQILGYTQFEEEINIEVERDNKILNLKYQEESK